MKTPPAKRNRCLHSSVVGDVGRLFVFENEQQCAPIGVHGRQRARAIHIDRVDFVTVPGESSDIN